MSQEIKMGNYPNPAGSVPPGFRAVAGVIQPSTESDGSQRDARSQIASFASVGFGGGLRGPLFDAAPTPPAKTSKQIALEGCQKAYQELIGAATKAYSAELEKIAKGNSGQMTTPSRDTLLTMALAEYTQACDAADKAYAANEARYKDK